MGKKKSKKAGSKSVTLPEENQLSNTNNNNMESNKKEEEEPPKAIMKEVNIEEDNVHMYAMIHLYPVPVMLKACAGISVLSSLLVVVEQIMVKQQNELLVKAVQKDA